MPPRSDKQNSGTPRPGGRKPSDANPEQIRGRTYTLREISVGKRIGEFVPQETRRQIVDFRGIGILVTRREFVDRAIGISGETLVTAGLFVLLFLGWHVWFNDIVQGAAQDKAASALSNTWTSVPTGTTEFDRAAGTSDGAITDVPPPVVKSPGEAQSFATVLIPRFGSRYERTVAEGVDVDPDRVRVADGVGEFHFATVGEARGDDILRNIAAHVGGAAVHFRRVFSRKGTAAVTAHAAVGVDDDFSTSEA